MSQNKQNSFKSDSDPRPNPEKNNSYPPVSLIITTLNEADTINLLLKAIAGQTHLPDEVIIVDGGSQDDTIHKIKKFQRFHPELTIELYRDKGFNIPQGRNFAIEEAQHELIAITDAGCIPEPDWLENLLKKYQETQAPVVAGYYKGEPKTPFEEAVVPYTLVMPDQIDYTRFLPASRSMLLTKQIWDQLEGFREDLDVSEDFAFANKVKRYHIKTAFARDAVVAWLPRSDLQEFFVMIFKFARGDIKAGIIRTRVLLVFLRYWLGLVVIIWAWPYLALIISLMLIILAAYSVWAINKNKKYVPQGWHWLPVLQIAADLGVLFGTTAGVLSLLTPNFLKKNQQNKS